MKNGNTPLINGLILAGVVVYLSWYFSVNGLWNPASVVVLILIALLSAGQIVIWFMYFRVPKNDKKSGNAKNSSKK